MRSRIIIAILSIFASFSIAYAIHETIPAETTLKVPGADAAEIYKYITALDPYNKWSLWPGTKRMSKARPPLGVISTFVSENAAYSIRKGQPMIDSSFIVTENYDETKNFTGLFVMYKIKGYNPSAGDWFWAQYGTRGNVVSAGQVKACIDCHTKQKDNDYIFTETFVK
jgi:hypothetical protein